MSHEKTSVDNNYVEMPDEIRPNVNINPIDSNISGDNVN